MIFSFSQNGWVLQTLCEYKKFDSSNVLTDTVSIALDYDLHSFYRTASGMPDTELRQPRGPGFEASRGLILPRLWTTVTVH